MWKSVVLVVLHILLPQLCLSVYSPPVLETRTVREGTTSFRLDLMPLLRRELGVQADSAERISFFKEKEAYPFHLLSDGQIGLQGVLDREQVCRSGSPCSERCCKLLRVEVRLATSQTREFYIRLMIEDVNDSPPTFENHIDRVYYSLSEETSVGHELELPAASDADTAQNGVKEYKIASKLPDNATFDRHFQLIDSQWPNTPKLRLTVPLDREETPEIGFVLLAVDGGRPQRTGSLSVRIEVKDVNDQAPKIVDFRPGYIIRLNETATSFGGGGYSRQRVAYFRVEDGDSGENGRVKCDIKPPPGVQPRLRADRYFEIKPSSGGGGPNQHLWEVKTLTAIDYEQVKNFSFYIVVSDFGQPRLSSSVSVSIIVQNIDDHLISISFWNAGDRRDRVELLENSPSGLKIASVEVKDSDLELKSEYGRIHCRLTGGAELFRLEEKEVFGLTKEFNLRTAAVFDREQRDEHRVIVVCQDSMNSAASSTATLTVAVADVNDCLPEFSRQLYRGSVPENSPRRTTVRMDASNRIRAVDRDAFPNNRIVYRLQGPDAAPFSISSQGEISIDGELDYERQRNYRLNVTAVNENNASMSSVANVLIDVIDVNDNPPVISDYDKGYRFNVQEEISDVIIGRINGTDADTLPENSRVRFRILTADGGGMDGLAREAERYFRVDASSGEVRVVARIDRERHQYFQFRVLAENPSRLVLTPGSSRLSANELGSPSVTSVTVYVTNVNDHPPRLCQTLSGPGGAQASQTCSEPPQPLRVQFIDSGIFYNRPVHSQEHRCTLFDYEIRDADGFDDSTAGSQQQAARVTLENVTELRLGVRKPVLDGSVQFRLDSQQLCIQSLPAKQADREIYEMIIRVEDPGELRHRRDYPCVVTIVRTRQQPPLTGGDISGGRGSGSGGSQSGAGGNYNYERGGHQNVNRLDDGPVERRNFVIIVTLVTIVVFIIVIVFAFVLFFYVKKIDRSMDDKDYENEAVTMPLQGQSATTLSNTANCAGIVAKHQQGVGSLAEVIH